MANAYLRYPNNFFTGTRVLTLEQRGAYNDLLDLYVARDGHLVDDDRTRAHDLAIDVRMWRRLKRELHELQKIELDGLFIIPKNGAETLTKCRASSEKGKRAAAARWGSKGGELDSLEDFQNVSKSESKGRNSNLHKKDVGVANPLAGYNLLNSDYDNPLDYQDTDDAPAMPLKLYKKDIENTVKTDRCSKLFNSWWEIYPRKVGRGKAKSSYEKAITKISPPELLDLTKQFVAAVVGVDKNFIPHAATWLNQERWTDDPRDINPETQAKTELSRRGGSIVEAARRFLDEEGL